MEIFKAVKLIPRLVWDLNYFNRKLQMVYISVGGTAWVEVMHFFR